MARSLVPTAHTLGAPPHTSVPLRFSSAGSTLSLLCVGEIGRRADLGAVAGLQSVLQAAFENPSVEVQSAGSFALGNVAIGSMKSYLPYILAAIQKQPKQQCSLLHALKQVLLPPATDEPRAPVSEAEISAALQLLLTFMESEEDGVRSVVAECLGSLLQTHPAVTVPALQQRTSAPQPAVRATACHAVRCAKPHAPPTTWENIAPAIERAFALSGRADIPRLYCCCRCALVDRVTPADAALEPVIQDFLRLLADPQPPVRHSAVLLVSAAVHHKLSLVRSRLPELLPQLHEQTVVRPELCRVMDLGPFKVNVDDGLDLRKAAYECLDTLLEVAPKSVATGALAAALKAGLGDQYDVKITSHSILSRMCAVATGTVLGELDAIVEQLEKTLTEKLKQDAVKQEARMGRQRRVSRAGGAAAAPGTSVRV